MLPLIARYNARKVVVRSPTHINSKYATVKEETMHRRNQHIHIILSLILLSSCSSQVITWGEIEKNLSTTAGNFWIKKYPEPQNDNTIDKEAEDSRTISGDSAVEIIWLVPEGRVTKYILRYGTDQENLQSIVEIQTKNLSSVMHPKFGKVYKHIIMGVPANSKIYYTLQAGNELGLSDPTPVASETSRDN